MATAETPANTDASYGESTGGAPDPTQFKQYLAELKARVERGEQIREADIPLDYKVKSGQVLPKSWWDRWKTDILMSAAIVGGGIGASYLAPAAGASATGGGAAAAGGGSGALASTTTAPLFSMLPGGASTGAALGGTAAAGAGGAGLLAGGAGKGLAAAGGFGSNLKSALGLAGAAAPVLAMLKGPPSQSDELSKLFAAMPELKQSLALQQKQSERNDPLHAALTQLAMNFLPRSAFGALPGRPAVDPSSPSPQPPVPRTTEFTR